MGRGGLLPLGNSKDVGALAKNMNPIMYLGYPGPAEGMLCGCQRPGVLAEQPQTSQRWPGSGVDHVVPCLWEWPDCRQNKPVSQV